MRLVVARLAFIAACLIASAAKADTIIAGGNLSSQTWVAANGPYTIQGDVTVIAGATLTIEAGTVVQASSGATESAAVSRNLAGPQTSASESAFPASIISTPKVFPINRRDPLAAAALILLVGVARELFKAWRRQANNYWVA